LPEKAALYGVDIKLLEFFMKNVFKSFGIIALAAVIGFIITTCGNSPGGDHPGPPNPPITNGPIKVRSVISGNSSGAVGSYTPRPARSAVRAAATVEGDEEYTKLYNALGAKKGSITPTMLELAVQQLAVHRVIPDPDHPDGRPPQITLLSDKVVNDNGDWYYDSLLVDLAKPIVIDVDEEILPGDVYPLVQFGFAMTGLLKGDGTPIISRVSFPKPEGFNYETHAYSQNEWLVYYNDDDDRGIAAGQRLFENDGDNITTDLNYLDPRSVNTSYGPLINDPFQGSLGFDIPHPIGALFMGGNDYKMFRALNNMRYTDIHSGLFDYPFGWGDDRDSPNILVPFEGVTIPENAASVRFEVYWDMKDIIEWYEGPTNSPDDDIFILKNKFWEAFSVAVIIELIDDITVWEGEWVTYVDTSSDISVTTGTKNGSAAYTISGNLTENSWAVAAPILDTRTIKAARIMKQFTFMAQGDGREYIFAVGTEDTATGNYCHYQCRFTASETPELITVNIPDDLIRPDWGDPYGIEFTKIRIGGIEFAPVYPAADEPDPDDSDDPDESFVLTVWDLSFNYL
jgi:hypothetical protein